MSKEHEHIYEAGYRDGSTNYELEHCPACKNVADLQDVLAENAKLRELVKVMWLYDYAGKFSTKQEDMEHLAMVYQRIRELGVEVS